MSFTIVQNLTLKMFQVHVFCFNVYWKVSMVIVRFFYLCSHLSIWTNPLKRRPTLVSSRDIGGETRKLR